MKNTPFRKLTLAGAAAVGALSIVGGSLVYAQTPTTTPTTPSSTQQTPRQAPDNSAYVATLAANLGVNADALKAALTKTNLAEIAKLEAAGTITKAQADQMRQHVNDAAAAGHFDFGIHGPGMGKGGPGGDRGGPGGMRGDDPAALATFLGVTADQLRTEMMAGTSSLAQIAQTHGKSRDQLKVFLTTQTQARFAKGVTDGRLTQAQADEMLKQFTANLDAHIDQVGGPRGGPGGGRGMGPGGANQQGSAPQTN